MSDTVERVVDKRVGHDALGRDLGRQWQTRKSTHQGGSVKRNVQERGRGVPASQRVERTPHGNTSESVERRHNECQLLTVDGQVR